MTKDQATALIQSIAPHCQIDWPNDEEVRLTGLWSETQNIWTAKLQDLENNETLLRSIAIEPSLPALIDTEFRTIEFFHECRAISDFNYRFSWGICTGIGRMVVVPADISHKLRAFFQVFNSETIEARGHEIRFIESINYIKKAITQAAGRNKVMLAKCREEFPINDRAQILRTVKLINLELAFDDVLMDIPVLAPFTAVEIGALTGLANFDYYENSQAICLDVNIDDVMMEYYLSAIHEGSARFRFLLYYNVLESLKLWIAGRHASLAIPNVTTITNSERSQMIAVFLYATDGLVYDLLMQVSPELEKAVTFDGGYQWNPITTPPNEEVIASNLYTVRCAIAHIRSTMTHGNQDHVSNSPEDQAKIHPFLRLMEELAKRCILKYASEV